MYLCRGGSIQEYVDNSFKTYYYSRPSTNNIIDIIPDFDNLKLIEIIEKLPAENCSLIFNVDANNNKTTWANEIQQTLSMTYATVEVHRLNNARCPIFVFDHQNSQYFYIGIYHYHVTNSSGNYTSVIRFSKIKSEEAQISIYKEE